VARERRMIARSAFTSTKLKHCSDPEFLLFVSLIVEADDEGRGQGDPESVALKARNRPWSDAKVKMMLEHLSQSGLVMLYTNNGGQYYEVVDFLDYQQGSWHGVSAKPSKILSPSHPDSVVHHERWTGTPLTVDGSTITASNRSEVNRSEVKVRPSSEHDGDFEVWWKDYPRKVGKVKARTFYNQLRSEDIPAELLTDARDAYIKELRDNEIELRFVMHPERFLGVNRLFEDYASMKGWEGK